jgi:phage terminase large subunit GpA-like protein
MFDDLISEDDKDDEETNFIVQYNIIFDDQAQQDVWFDFIKALKTQYAEAETIGERLVAFIKDTGYGES